MKGLSPSTSRTKEANLSPAAFPLMRTFFSMLPWRLLHFLIYCSCCFIILPLFPGTTSFFTYLSLFSSSLNISLLVVYVHFILCLLAWSMRSPCNFTVVAQPYATMYFDNIIMNNNKKTPFPTEIIYLLFLSDFHPSSCTYGVPVHTFYLYPV